MREECPDCGAPLIMEDACDNCGAGGWDDDEDDYVETVEWYDV